MNDVLTEAQEWLGARAAAVEVEEGRRRLIVLSEQGIGEQARATVLCAGLRAADPKTHITLVGHYDGTMAKHDMAAWAQKCAIIDEFIAAPRIRVPAVDGMRNQGMERPMLLDALRPHCDVLYDAMPIAVKAYHRDDPKAQAEADNRIAPFGAIYGGYPFDNWRLIYTLMPWWEIMSLTAGVDVNAESLSDDLLCAAPLDCAAYPEDGVLPPGGSQEELRALSGSGDEAMGVIEDSRPYVVIHSGAGQGSRNKIAPKAVTDAIIRELESHGLACVQVGIDGEQDFSCAYHRKNLRLPLTNRLIQKAVALVDNEGLLSYEAHGLATPAAVLFSVTPYSIYGLPGNLNVIPGLSKWDVHDRVQAPLIGTPRRCAYGTCFWGGQWTWGDGWCGKCRAPVYNAPNPEWPACLNFPKPKDAAAAVWLFVKNILEGKDARRPAQADLELAGGLVA